MRDKNPTEEEQKRAAYENEAKCGSGIGGIVGLRSDLEAGQPMQPGLRDRVQMKLRQAQRESNKLGRLDELSYLLEKHPDVARILELMEGI